MPGADKTYTPFDSLIVDRPLTPVPWQQDGTFRPDYELLELLLAVPLDTDSGAPVVSACFNSSDSYTP